DIGNFAGSDYASVCDSGGLPGFLHFGTYCRAGAVGHSVAAAWTAQRRLRVGHDAMANLSLCAAADGLSHHHAAADVGIDESDQEHGGRLFDRTGRTVLPYARDGRDDVSLFRSICGGDIALPVGCAGG